MNQLGKGIGIAACAAAIAAGAIVLHEPHIFWAFIPVAWIAQSWN